MFKRRKPLSKLAAFTAQVYPATGFKRAALYHWHRLLRLPDPPHRVARGVFAGTFVNFPPIFGLQIGAAMALAYAMRGNILAAVLATLLSNPVTTPLIALVSLKLGHWMLGSPDGINLTNTFAAFAAAGGDIWYNISAIFTSNTAHWDGLILFWHRIYLPYLVGSIIPGLVTSALLSWLTIPTLTAYQALRARRSKARAEQRKDAPPPP